MYILFAKEFNVIYQNILYKKFITDEITIYFRRTYIKKTPKLPLFLI